MGGVSRKSKAGGCMRAAACQNAGETRGRKSCFSPKGKTTQAVTLVRAREGGSPFTF